MKKPSTNVRIYEDTHKIIKKFAKEYRIPLATLIHRMALKLELEQKDLTVIEY